MVPEPGPLSAPAPRRHKRREIVHLVRYFPAPVFALVTWVVPEMAANSTTSPLNERLDEQSMDVVQKEHAPGLFILKDGTPNLPVAFSFFSVYFLFFKLNQKKKKKNLFLF